MAKTPGEMVAAVTRNMQEKTGRTVEEWAAILKKDGPAEGRNVQRDWLKKEHGLGHVQAAVVADQLNGGGLSAYEDPVALLEAQYRGKKAQLRPIYDALVHAARRIGKDVKVAPCQTYVPLIRKHSFAVIKATTGTRVDLGLALADTLPEGRLVKANKLGGSERITHRIGLASLKEVDAEVVRWLKRAYEADGATRAALKKKAARG